MSQQTDAIIRELRAWGLTFPGAHLKSPWPGHLDLAVKNKTFAYLSLDGEPIAVGVKLPHSSKQAFLIPNTRPTPYGLGKSGWVSLQFAIDEVPPVDLLRAWLVESYRSQAPKTLVKQFDAAFGQTASTPDTPSAKKTPPPKKTAATKKKAATKKTAATKKKATTKKL